MGYSAELRPKAFYGRKELGTREGDSLAAKLAGETSLAASNTKMDEEKGAKGAKPKKTRQEEEQEVDLDLD